MAKEKHKEEEKDDQTWDELPRSRVIHVENVSTLDSLSNNKNILLKSICSDFQFKDESPPRDTLFVYNSVSDDSFSFYVKTERKQRSPWKGMHSYIPGRCVKTTDPESQHPLIWLLKRLCREPKLLTDSGIFLVYECLPSKHLRVDFYLEHDRVFKTVADCSAELPIMFKQKVPLLLKSIIKGKQDLPEVDLLSEGEMDEQRRHDDLNFEKFFELAETYKHKFDDPIPKYKLDTDNLNFCLMPYQQDTVRWMVHREAENTVDDNLSWSKCEKLDTNHPAFYYPFIGVVTRQQLNPNEFREFAKRHTLKGGILSDEMGLGKTVEVLSLISTARKGKKVELYADDLPLPTHLKQDHIVSSYTVAEQVRVAEVSFKEMRNAKQHSADILYNVNQEVRGKTVKCPDCKSICLASVCGWDFEKCGDEKFLCPDCMMSKKRRPVKTSLVIVPESLIFQWFTEIAKHCSDSFKVMFYFGVKKHGYLQPYEIDKYDVILTTYDTIRREMNFSDLKPQKRTMRNETPKMYLKSSLIHTSFWRIIVDESQVMPQTSNSMLSQMLSNIEGVNWWCVTGTPLVRTVSDMSTLFKFLGLFPFNNLDFFAQYVHPQYLNYLEQLQDTEFDERNLPKILLLEVLGRVMSRKMKEDVEDQINLPELTEIEKLICFSDVEERQYKEEKEKISSAIAGVILKAPDSARLADLACRDRVLHQLGALRETILTGHNSLAEPTASGMVCSPETIVFRLVHTKKTHIEKSVRNFVAAALGLAGARRLMLQQEEALGVYQHIMDEFEDVVQSTCFKDVVGRDYMTKFKPESNGILEVDDEEDGVGDVIATKTPEELEHIQKVATLVRNIQQVCKRFTRALQTPAITESAKTPEKREAESAAGPSNAKRPRIEDALRMIQEEVDAKNEEKLEKRKKEKEAELARKKAARLLKKEEKLKPLPNLDEEEEPEEEEIIEEEGMSMEEYEEEERKKHAHKMANLAFKPIRMDATSEFHLIVNFRNLEFSLGIADDQDVSLKRLEQPMKRLIRLEIQALTKILEAFPMLETIWIQDPRHTFERVEEFFELLRTSCVDKPSESIYEHGYQLRDCLVERLPELPYLPFYDTGKLRPQPMVHNTKRCMGGCSKEYLECEQFKGRPCLPLQKIVEKTITQIRKIDTGRQFVHEKLVALMGLVLEMSDPNLLLSLLTETSDGSTGDRAKMMEIINCKHPVMKGTREEKEQLVDFYIEQHPCELCDMWCKLMALTFDAGFLSFHGEARQSSGVQRFADWLCHIFEPRERDGTIFTRHFLCVFFDRVRECLKAFRSAADIIVELVDRYQELSTAQTLLTDDMVNHYFRNQNMVDDMDRRRDRYAADHLNRSDYHLDRIKLDVKELRYLTNLMKKQLSGETSESDECPICKCDIDSFMVFTCGHRVCTECFHTMKDIAKQEYDYALGLICPSCRVRNKVQQIMMARTGHRDTVSLIPGVRLSAKITVAIQLMREILNADDSNKIIVFTSIDSSCSTTWHYLQKIFKLAELPFIAASRSNCGKTVVDFEVSEDKKILLCSLNLCANGLNMTGANHIIFLDPPHLRSVLNQAIGRINRFGQRRAMRVYHLVVQGSLDSELREIAKRNNRRDTEKKSWTIGDVRAMFGINRDALPTQNPRFEEAIQDPEPMEQPAVGEA